MDQALPIEPDALDMQRLFQALFLHMSEGVALHRVLCDPEGRPVNYRILDVNPQFKYFTGLEREQVVGLLATEAYGTPAIGALLHLTNVASLGK